MSGWARSTDAGDVDVKSRFRPHDARSAARSLRPSFRERREPFEEFVASLVKAHGDIRRRLSVIGTTLKEQDVPAGLASLRELMDTLDRHVVEEEARVLKVLIGAHGRDGAGDAIRTMQQHRRVHRLVNAMLDRLPESAEDLSKAHVELEALQDEHFRAGEGRIFPWAIETHAKPGREGQSRKE